MSNEEITKKGPDKRLITGIVVGLSVLACLFAGGYILATCVAVFVFFSLKEYVQILNHKGFQPSFRIILFISFLLFIISVAHLEKLYPIVLFIGITLSFCAVLFKLRQPYIANVATTVFGFILCWLPCHIYLLRGLGASGKGFLTLFEQNEGLGFLILLFFTILATDIAAFLIGKNFGKTKLCPDVSPKKTVEGAVGGAIAAIITAFFFGQCIGLSIAQSLISGVLITVFAQIGDLSESLLKRDAGVKDSGNSLPGHGGFLDRADSYLISAPVAYYYFKFFVMTDFTWLNLISTVQKVLSNVGLS